MNPQSLTDQRRSPNLPGQALAEGSKMVQAPQRPTLILQPTPAVAADGASTGAVVGEQRGARSVSSLILRLERVRPASVVDLATAGPGALTTLGRWSAAAAAAHDGVLVVDPQGHVVSLSARGAELLDCSEIGVIGRHLLDIVELVDFEYGGSDPDYAERIPPLAAVSGDGIIRSLIRVRHGDATLHTLDVSGLPLHDAAGKLVGSLSWLSPLPW